MKWDILFISSLSISGSIYNYCIMPWTKRALEVFKFQQSHIVGQYQDELSQCKISENLSISLSTVNRVIVKFNREGKKCTASWLGPPGLSDRTVVKLKGRICRLLSLMSQPGFIVQRDEWRAVYVRRTANIYIHGWIKNRWWAKRMREMKCDNEAVWIEFL